MFEWLNIDVSGRVDEDILSILDGALDPNEGLLHLLYTSSIGQISHWYRTKGTKDTTESRRSHIGLSHDG